MSIITGRPITEIAQYLKRDVVSHTRRVQDLYKRICRNEESWLVERADIRYKMAIVRAEFEKHRHLKDMRVAKMLLDEGERQLWLNIHPQPKKFAFSPGGIIYERYFEHMDWHADYWYPGEKARYPYYFAKRELRKKEYIEMWEKGNQNNAKEVPNTNNH